MYTETLLQNEMDYDKKNYYIFKLNDSDESILHFIVATKVHLTKIKSLKIILYF